MSDLTSIIRKVLRENRGENYMFFSNLINIIQTVVTKNFIFDESKIRAEVEVKKGKPKKKSGFTSKMQELMKQQQQIQQQKGKQPKK